MKIKGEYIIRDFDTEKIAVPINNTTLDSNVLIVLNETGLFIWHLLKRGAEFAEMVDALCNEYDVERTEAEEDIVLALEYLKDKVEFE